MYRFNYFNIGSRYLIIQSYYRFKILVKTVVQSLANTFVRFAVSMMTLINSSSIVMDVASVGKIYMYQG